MTKRVLLIHYTPPGVIGGVEHIMHEHVRLLAAHGYRMQVAAGRGGEGTVRTHVLPEIDVAGGVNTEIERQLAAGAVGPLFHRTRRQILAKLEALTADADYVLVHNAFTLHFCQPLTAALWQLAARRPAGSVIAWCHDLAWTNPLYLPEMHPGYPWDLLRVPAPNTTYITVSGERAAELRSLWGTIAAPIQVVPNGIDVSEFLRLSPETIALIERYALLSADLVLLLPVRVTRRKNIEAAIRAVRLLAGRGLRVRLLVTGPEAPHHPGRSRTYLAELLALREELKAQEEVVFVAADLGTNLSERTVAELYAIADALLLPSAQEGFGLPIIEAGLARVPAVVSDIPIFSEVGGTDVWTFDPFGDPDKIAGQVLAAVENRPSQLFRRVVRDFRWDVIVERSILPLLAG